ncbi:MAG: amidohydrolase family protein [Spirochaetales bacterium]|nr:amidohydrolase family protein [Spirochaetales bacterium]
MQESYSLSGISILTSGSFLEKSSIKINQSEIQDIGTVSDKDIKVKGEAYLYPAIINVHDHFRGNYLPKVGPKEGTFYLNWSYWDNDLKSAPVYEEREKNTVEDLYALSMYKNIFAGVVTVNDHYPHNKNNKYVTKMPIRVVTDYTLVHAISSLSLNWGDPIEVEHKKAIDNNFPFITHCAEGFDKETQAAVKTLEKVKCLDDHDVLVHCIGFSDEDIKKVQKVGATIVWCPGSNMYMFNVTCKIRKILEAKINVCIGTDSTHSGTANILEEIRWAREVYKRMYHEEISPETLFKLVTINPARAFRMQHKIGSIEIGKLADLLLIKPGDKDPYNAIVNLQMEDIELLTCNGNPVYGAREYEELFKLRDVEYTKIKVRNRDKLIIGDPVRLMSRIRKAVGYKKTFDFIPLDD